jgi:hypothetical protein
MAAFYGSGLLFLGSALPCLKWGASLFRYLFSLSAALFFLVSNAAIISFISLYIYELPTHHCPFDILQKNYGFVGYPLYLTLFGGALCGILPGIFQPLKKIPSLKLEMQRIERKWILLAVFFTACFLVLVSWPIVFGQFKLAGYSLNG